METIRLDALAPVKLVLGRPAGNFARDYQLGRFDAIVERGERELERSGPRFNLHHALGMAYSAIGDRDHALEHLTAEVAWQLANPRPFGFTAKMALATAYSNLGGAQESAGQLAEAEQTVRQSLRVDETHMMLNLQMARFDARRGDEASALGHLEVASRDQRVRPPGRTLLLFGQDPVFAAIRGKPRFQRILLRAAAS